MLACQRNARPTARGKRPQLSWSLSYQPRKPAAELATFQSNSLISRCSQSRPVEVEKPARQSFKCKYLRSDTFWSDCALCVSAAVDMHVINLWTFNFSGPTQKYYYSSLNMNLWKSSQWSKNYRFHPHVITAWFPVALALLISRISCIAWLRYSFLFTPFSCSSHVWLRPSRSSSCRVEWIDGWICYLGLGLDLDLDLVSSTVACSSSVPCVTCQLLKSFPLCFYNSKCSVLLCLLLYLHHLQYYSIIYLICPPSDITGVFQYSSLLFYRGPKVLFPVVSLCMMALHCLAASVFWIQQ